MTDHTDRELQQSINEVTDIYNVWRSRINMNSQYGDLMSSILTLATVTHHQNGMKP